MPFFTIVTVTFNSELYLHSCLNSVLCQDFADYEHLVIDGRSSDSTLDILSDFPNPRLRYISEPDLGIYDAMNKGIANAHGTYVGFLNSDDFFQTSTILTRIHSVLSSTRADICYSDINYVFPECTARVARHWSSQSFNRYGIASGAFPPHPSFYCKLSMLREINGFKLKYSLAADFDLMLRLVVDKRYVHAYLPITSVSMRLGGATNNSFANIVSQNLQILSSLFSVLPPLASLRYYFLRVFRRLF